MDEGERPVAGEETKQRLREGASRVHRLALATATAATAVVAAAPPY